MDELVGGSGQTFSLRKNPPESHNYGGVSSLTGMALSGLDGVSGAIGGTSTGVESVTGINVSGMVSCGERIELLSRSRRVNIISFVILQNCYKCQGAPLATLGFQKLYFPCRFYTI
jgi:hypothetical protein